ncbi:MAG: L-threonylcarbamoyladenylate synthase [Bdellovibrionota bacterium]|nr:MAG: L-threonylcarbamoyladenylate synthase [Bdellovibrionota bacterium]
MPISLPTPELIARGASLLQAGQLVGFPTETVYGLGANALDPQAIALLYRTKGRPLHNPLIVHIPSLEEVASIALLSAREESRLELLEPFIPGPLTVVLKRREQVPPAVSAGKETIAVRAPSHHVAQQLLRAAALPIAAPSANRSSYVSPTTAQHVYDEFGNEIPLILDGGPCQVGIESTVLAIHEEEPLLLRPGIVTIEQLESKLGEPVRRASFSPQTPSSPGQLLHHYAPHTPVAFLDTIDTSTLPPRTALLAFAPPPPELLTLPFREICTLSAHGDFEHVARCLFGALRELDKKQLDLIVVERCNEAGVGLAIMDRLVRASATTVRQDGRYTRTTKRA